MNTATKAHPQRTHNTHCELLGVGTALLGGGGAGVDSVVVLPVDLLDDQRAVGEDPLPVAHREADAVCGGEATGGGGRGEGTVRGSINRLVG